MEESAAIREKLRAAGADYIAAPVSGNAGVIVAGKLSAVASATAFFTAASSPVSAESCSTLTPLSRPADVDQTFH